MVEDMRSNYLKMWKYLVKSAILVTEFKHIAY